MLNSIHHIGIAVKSLDESIEKYKTIFNVQDIHRERIVSQKVEIASFNISNVKIELTAPISYDSPISKFLEKRGEGIHHIAVETTDIKSELERLNNAGIELINKAPQLGSHDMQIAFMHPKSASGVLIELCQ